MTVPNGTARTSATGSGSIGQEIPFSFPISVSGDLLVKKRTTATGAETTLAETTNYTVAIDENLGGTVTTVTAIETTEQIHIIRDTPFTQNLNLETGGAFNADNVESAIDRAVRLAGENRDKIQFKALTFPDTDSRSMINELPSIANRASLVCSFDSLGNVTATSAVPTGSVSFSTFGTNIAEAANALAGKSVINLHHVIDATDYAGVDKTGATDSTAGIVLALAAAAGRHLYFPAGIYLTDLMTLTTQMKITGEHMSRTIIKLNASQNTNLIEADNTNLIHMADLTLDGNRDNNSSTSYCFKADTAISHRFDKVRFTEGNDGCVRFTTSNDIAFNDCYLIESDKGANIGGATTLSCEQINFIGCVIQNNDTYGIQYDSDSGRGEVSTVRGCWFENDGGQTPTDFIIVDSDHIHLEANKCNVTGNTNSAIRFKTGAEHNMALNNVFHQTGPTYYIVYDSGAKYNISMGNSGGSPTSSTDNDGENWILEYNTFTDAGMFNEGRTIHKIESLANEATPSVKASNFFITGGTTGITNLDDGENGQVVHISFRHSVLVTYDATKIILKGNVSHKFFLYETLTLLKDNDIWLEIGRGRRANPVIGEVETDTIEISAAEIILLNSAPKTLVAAQGADTVVEFISAMLIFDYGTVAYDGVAGGEDLVIEYATGQDLSASIEVTGFLDQANDEIRLIPKDLTVFPITTDLVPLKNSAVRLLMKTGEIATGDGTMTVKVSYRIHTLGL